MNSFKYLAFFKPMIIAKYSYEIKNTTIPVISLYIAELIDKKSEKCHQLNIIVQLKAYMWR